MCLVLGHMTEKGLAQVCGERLPLWIELPAALSLPTRGETLPGQDVLPKYGIIQWTVVLVLAANV